MLSKYRLTLLLLPIFTGLLALIVFRSVQKPPLVQAQLVTPVPSCVLNLSSDARAEGLISAKGFTSGTFDTKSGACVFGNQAAYAFYQLPSYRSMKGQYYDRAKTTGSIVKEKPITLTATQIPRLNQTKAHLFHFENDLAIGGDLSTNLAGTDTAIVFVDEDLTIGPITSPTAGQLTYGTGTTGLVFIVGGKVLIHPTVTRIDAVIIAFGNICTAASNPGDCPPPSGSPPYTDTNQLIVKGSLIALNRNQPILFQRNLTDNRSAAERIEQQPKFIAILKDVLSNTLEIRTEL